MSNSIRPRVGEELKEPLGIIDADPYGWWAIHTALVFAARQVVDGGTDLLHIAQRAVRHTAHAGFGVGREDRAGTRYTGKPIMAWQDAMYVVNELPEWLFPDDVLLIGWLVECGGPGMGRGPATASFEQETPKFYIHGTRNKYNKGTHRNGPGWPRSSEWCASDCRYMRDPSESAA